MTRKFKVMENVSEWKKDEDFISREHVIIPAGTVLMLEEVNDLDETVWKAKTGQNICSRCGGSGSVQSECPGYPYGGGNLNCLVYHSKPCPNCR